MHTSQYKSFTQSKPKSPWENNYIRDVQCFVKAVLWLPMIVSLIIVHCHILLHQIFIAPII